MKYTVCYAMYCSVDVEADNTDDALDLALEPPYREMAEHVDYVEPTLVLDEKGHELLF